jgi:hypothetical protein
VEDQVAPGTELHSDEHSHTWFSEEDYTHNVVNHAECYVKDNVAYERNGKFLELAETRDQRHVRERRAVSPVPVRR